MKRIALVFAGIAAIGVNDSDAEMRAKGDSGQTQVWAHVPLICGAEISGFNIVSHGPLVLDATVRQSCNGDHELSVNYDPASVSNTSDLSFDYGGRAPSRVTLGSAGFGEEHHTDVVRTLHVVYTGGTDAEHDQFSRTIGIALTPR
jgi:hypothetical protein